MNQWEALIDSFIKKTKNLIIVETILIFDTILIFVCWFRRTSVGMLQSCGNCNTYWLWHSSLSWFVSTNSKKLLFTRQETSQDIWGDPEWNGQINTLCSEQDCPEWNNVSVGPKRIQTVCDYLKRIVAVAAAVLSLEAVVAGQGNPASVYPAPAHLVRGA